MKTKTFLIIAMMAMIIASCAKKEKEFHIEGYLIADCEHKHPLGNVKLSINQAAEVHATTTTDSWGYFSMSGTYRDNPKASMVGLELNIAAESTFGKVGLAYALPDRVNLDTVYRISFVWAILKMQNTNSLQADDSLYLTYNDYEERFTQVFGKSITRAIPGPFHDGQVLDTILTEGPRHPDYLTENAPIVSVKRKEEGKVVSLFSASLFNTEISGCGSYNEIPIRLKKL